MTKEAKQAPAPLDGGILIHSARLYDFLAQVMMFGREGEFREKIIDLARLRTGESVLDVGCGTGTLAIAAKRRVGTAGTVCGIDASPEMVARACKKAKKTGLKIDFRNEALQELPFTDAQFDVVLSTLMLHHLPRKIREDGIREIRRVMKPGGRALVVDFGGAERRKGFFAHFHRPRHGYVKANDVVDLLNLAGLNVIEHGAVGIRDLHFALAEAPAAKDVK